MNFYNSQITDNTVTDIYFLVSEWLNFPKEYPRISMGVKLACAQNLADLVRESSKGNRQIEVAKLLSQKVEAAKLDYMNGVVHEQINVDFLLRNDKGVSIT